MRYNSKIIGARVRAERRDLNWSQDKLLDQLKQLGVPLSRATLSHLENGDEVKLDLDLVLALCELFRCDIGYLLGHYDQKFRERADVCDATGLSEGAVCALRQEKNRTVSKTLMAGPQPIEILSKLIECWDFWNCLWSLSWYSTPLCRTSMDFLELGSARPVHPAELPLEAAASPSIVGNMDDVLTAAATFRFRNAVQQAMGWAHKEPKSTGG
ncbi:Helix-turn-helix domain [uncultured Flavonifractor sp.]|nr:Helix-turn-helix domain [uncultured Flavonifractor sp.]